MPTWKNQRERPLGSRSDPQFRSTKKARTSVLQPKGIFCQHSDSVLKWFSSRALQFDPSWLTPWVWPVKPTVEKLGKTTQPSDMQKYEIINLFVEVAKFVVICYSSNRKLQELISRFFFFPVTNERALMNIILFLDPNILQYWKKILQVLFWVWSSHSLGNNIETLFWHIFRFSGSCG